LSEDAAATTLFFEAAAFSDPAVAATFPTVPFCSLVF
jgi:hypothetical protein